MEIYQGTPPSFERILAIMQDLLERQEGTKIKIIVRGERNETNKLNN